MNSEDKVDLSSINKSKKQFKLPKISNPFNKNSAGPGRDSEGKFTSGSGGLLSSNKFKAKQSIPLAVVAALVGGFFVFRSFASVTPPPAYQYSIATCKSNSLETLKKCKDESAEALVYRVQAATLGRQTDWGYKTWTQKLAGDRATTLRVAQEAEGTTEARWGSLSNKDYVDKIAGLAKPAQRAEWTKQMDEKKLTRVQLASNVANLFKISEAKLLEKTYKYDNKQFVEAIFKNLLKRGDNYVAPANDFWVKALNDEKYTRAQAVVTIAKSSEAISKNREDIGRYVASKPALKISPVAIEKQKSRAKDANLAAGRAKIHYEKGALYHQQAAAKLKSAASTQASVSKPGRQALTTIANFEKEARKSRNFAQQSATNAEKEFKNADKLFKEAKELTKNSPDISSSAVELARNKTAIYSASSKNKVKDIDGYISSIAGSYKVAEKKYQDEQKRIADAAALQKQKDQCRQSGGTWNNGCRRPTVGNNGPTGETPAPVGGETPVTVDVTKTHGPIAPLRLCSNIHQDDHSWATVTCVADKKNGILYKNGSSYQYRYTEIRICSMRGNDLSSCAWSKWNGSSF